MIYHKLFFVCSMISLLIFKPIHSSEPNKNLLNSEDKTIGSKSLEQIQSSKIENERLQNTSQKETGVSAWVDLFKKRIDSNTEYEDLFLAIDKDPSLLFLVASAIDNLNVSSLAQMKKQKEIAARLYTCSAKQKYQPAIAALPMFFCMNLNFTHAIYWEEKGVEAHIPECMLFRGMRLIAGKNFDGKTEQDPVEGFKWILIASDLHNQEAKEMVEGIMQMNSPNEKEMVQQAMQKAKEWKQIHLNTN